jgi:hypothetical protein
MTHGSKHLDAHDITDNEVNSKYSLFHPILTSTVRMIDFTTKKLSNITTKEILDWPFGN